MKKVYIYNFYFSRSVDELLMIATKSMLMKHVGPRFIIKRSVADTGLSILTGREGELRVK